MHALLLFALSASPSVRDLLDQSCAASGGKAALARLRTEHATAQVTAGGMSGKGDFLADLSIGAYADAVQLGPVTEVEGYDGKTVWSQDTSKQVHEVGDADARLGAAVEAYQHGFGYCFPERWPAQLASLGRRTEGARAFEVLQVTPQGGRAFELWLDAATALPDRFVEKHAIETHTTSFSDYRTVQGVKVPFAMKDSTGDPRYDTRLVFDRIVFGEAIDAARFRMPPPPPPDYAFAGGATSTTVPFDLLNNHIYVEVKLNGKGPFKMMCDTGGLNLITPTLAGVLGVKAQGALEGHGVGDNSEDVGLVKLDSLQVGAVTVRDQVFATVALESFSAVEGVTQNGLIGYEIFQRFGVTVDYAGHTLTLTDPAAFQPPIGATAVPFEFNDKTPQVKGEIDGLAATFDIDTGSRASLDLGKPFVDQNRLVAKYAPKYGGVAGWGLGGPTRGRFARAKVLKLGAVTIDAPVIGLSEQSKGDFSSPYFGGNVGSGLLKRFTLTFDYRKKIIYFVPNANAGQRDGYDRAGMWLNTDGKSFEVVDVVADGPAAHAGLQTGDKIVAIDGKAAAGLSLPEVRRRLREDAPGTKVKLRVVTFGKTREVVLELADLV